MPDDELDDIADQNDYRQNVGYKKNGRGSKRGRVPQFVQKEPWKRQLRGLRAQATRRKNHEST